MYRRSSSEPAPDTEEPKPFLQASAPTPRSQRIRAASTQPTRNATPSLSPAALSTPLELVPEHFYDASLTSGYTQPTEYSFTQKAEPSFNFNSFLFEEARSPYDPPTPASVDNSVDMFCHNMSQRPPAPLSINTSFSQDWNPPSPFSSSPSTPQLYSQQSSPCMSHTASADVEDTFAMADFNLDAFDNPSSFDHHSLDMTHSAFLSSEFEALAKEPAFGSLDQSKPPLLAGQDLDFSAFMSSLQSSTQYTL